MTPTIVYRGREGRRTQQGYKVRFLVKTSDDKEFWSHKSRDEAEQQAQEHCTHAHAPLTAERYTVVAVGTGSRWAIRDNHKDRLCYSGRSWGNLFACEGWTAKLNAGKIVMKEVCK